MELPSTASISRAVLALGLAIIVWRAATLPVSPAEAAAWDRVVRPPASSLLVTPGDWSAFLYGLLAKRAAGIFRLSEFSLRFPGILGALLYAYSLDRLRRRCFWLVSALTVTAILFNWFNLAGGTGLAVGLSALALAHPGAAGLWLGLALAACPQIGFVPSIPAALLLTRSGFRTGVDRIVIPAVAIGFVSLILPLSHGGPPLERPRVPVDRDRAIRAAALALRNGAGKTPARIWASPSASAQLAFYRASLRQRSWTIGDPQPLYFLWVTPDQPLAQPIRQVLFQQDGVVLAR